MTHTPTPWLLGNDRETIIATDDDIVVDCGIRRAEEAEANAAFIIRAVNCHEELLDAVKCLRQHLALFCTPSDSVAAEIFNLVDGVIAKATAS
jgi:hypothetical protein